jgi:Kdo2-lipid IVA lauroyltransferase/acyltransferase
MSGLFKYFSVLPLWLAHAVGWLLGWLTFALSGAYRQGFLENVRLAGIPRRQWWRAVGAAGKQVAELPRLWFGQPVQVDWDGAHHIDAALQRGRGIVFLTPHLGCFEITAQAYARRYGQAGKPMTVLFRPPRKTWLTELVVNARKRPGLDTAPTSLAGVKQMIKALKNGGCVGLLPDQVPPAGQGIWSPFFGRQAYTMTLAVRLALQTNATILVAWGGRMAWGKGYTVHVLPLQADIAAASGSASSRGLAADLEGAVAQVNRSMEDLIRSCPEQYLWGYARYKQPKVDP